MAGGSRRGALVGSGSAATRRSGRRTMKPRTSLVRGPGTSAPRSPLSLAEGQRGEARRPSSERRGRPRMHISQETVVWLIRWRRMGDEAGVRQVHVAPVRRPLSSSALAIGRMRTTHTRPRFPFGAGRRVRFRPQTRRWRRRYACHACDDLRGQSLGFATRGTHTARRMTMKAPPFSGALALARALRRATRKAPPLPAGLAGTRSGGPEISRPLPAERPAPAWPGRSSSRGRRRSPSPSSRRDRGS